MKSSIVFVTGPQFRVQFENTSPSRLHPAGKYKTWKPLHEAVLAVAQKYGTVSDTPGPAPDFYYSGDWFHALSDGFALNTLRGISTNSLHEFQQVVRRHHQDARLFMAGELGTRLGGLKILITSSTILMSLEGKSANECQEQLRALGANL